MADRAGWWVRVSTGKQDEKNQLPDIREYSTSNGYQYIKTYTVHGKSAYKAEQDPAWQEVVNDFKNNVIDVVIIWMVDRLDRKNLLHAIPMVNAAIAATGRVEFAEEDDRDIDLSTDEGVGKFGDRIKGANRESRIKSKRIRNKQKILRETGSIVGRAPWGYSIVKHDSLKVLEPTEVGRKYVPLIFEAVLDGKSLRQVAAWLDSENVPTVSGKKWNENYISNRLIKNSTYYGERPNAGNLETEALVSYSVWQQANAKLSSRARPGRGTVDRPKAFLSPVCGNPDCNATGAHPSPMYRYSDSYRCAGRGPQRKGCGNTVPVDYLDNQVMISMLEDDRPHFERTFIPGDDRSAVAKLRKQAMDAYARGDKARFVELDAQADAADTPAIPPHWETRETEQCEGEYFLSLDYEGRREELAQQWEVRAWRGSDDVPLVGIMPKVWPVVNLRREDFM